MKHKSNQSGFTLIEILVVVAIIGVLANTILVAFTQTRAKARDARRKADLNTLQKAVENYFTTNNGYPCTDRTPGNGTCTGAIDFWGAHGVCPPSQTHGFSGPSGYIPGLTPSFVGNLPDDPKPSDGDCAGYAYKSDGMNYKIISNSVGGLGGPESFPAVGEPFYDAARTIAPNRSWMATNNPAATNDCGAPATCW